MRYATLTIVVEGALESETDYFDYALLEAAIRDVADEAKADGYETQVYVLEHAHAPDADCECVQFLADLRPTYTFPQDAPPAEDDHPFA